MNRLRVVGPRCAWRLALALRHSRPLIIVGLSGVIVLVGGAAGRAQMPAVRTVMVRIAADDQIRALADGEARIREVVDEVSGIYERHFQIRWQIVDIVPWTSAPDLSLPASDLARLRMDPWLERGPADVVVLVSGRPCAPKEASGVAEPFGATVLVKPRCAKGDWGATMEQVLSHELAHLFGAFHVIHRPSVMRDGPADAFDDQTRRVIRLMREFDFARGVDGIDDAGREAFVEIFAEGHRPRTDNPLVTALTKAGGNWLRAGRTSEAIPRFRAAIRFDPTFAEAHFGLGVALGMQNKLDESIEALRAAVRLAPGSARAHWHLGLALRAQGKLDDAIEEFREVLTIEPRAAATHYQLALALAVAGRDSEARDHLEQARALGHDVPSEVVDALHRRGSAPARR